jgi:N-acetylglucosaminyl-diphospho-decaprenol L-rhamnosyltransferase
MSLSANIVILNYNGEALLRQFLPAVVSAAKESRYTCAVTVLDNCSRDGSEAYVKSEHPDVRWIAAPENKVLISYNAAAEMLTEDILILLNNDIRPEPGFVDPLVRVFEQKKDAFFAASHGDCPLAKSRWGILSAEIEYPGYDKVIDIEGVSFSAGIGAFDRKKFLEIGGYDELYLPGRYEDVDLCYRGWKRGWKGYYVPQSRKYHVGGASFDKAFNWKATQAMVFRNSVLFMIKNVTDPILFSKFLFMLILRLFSAALLGKWFIWTGFWGAIGRLPQALSARRRALKQFKVSDREVLKAVEIA